jgi:hypothetical protein
MPWPHRLRVQHRQDLCTNFDIKATSSEKYITTSADFTYKAEIRYKLHRQLHNESIWIKVHLVGRTARLEHAPLFAPLDVTATK